MVEYRSGGEGSCWSLFNVVPYIICQCYGSVVPHVMPQVLLIGALAVFARFFNPLREIKMYWAGADNPDAEDEPDLKQAMSTVGILLAFLMVFKTQSAYGQFWTAANRIEALINNSRQLARCTQVQKAIPTTA